MTREELSKFLKESVEWLIQEDMGCCTLPFDERLAVCVGWLPGYGRELRDDCIQSESEPDFAINAGIKVHTSDDMQTDYEFINAPYYDDGEVVMTDCSIEPDEDYDKLADYFLKEYEGLKDLEIEEDGRIVESAKCEEKEPCEVEGSYKRMKESLNDSPYKDIIAEHFDYDGDFDFLELVANTIAGIDDFDDEDSINQAIDESLIYYSDQWRIMQHYQVPSQANLDDATMEYADDIFAICKEIREQNSTDESCTKEEDKENINESLSKGEKIAKLIAKALEGECGAFSGENPIVEGNKLTLYSQMGDESWIFNDDGSVDAGETVDELVSNADPEDYGCESEEELRDYFEEYSHFDSIDDLLSSGLDWFMYIEDEDLLDEVHKILEK